MSAPRLIRLVEDDAAVARSLVALLEGWGFAVEVFADAESFLAAPPGPAPWCVLLDVRLPGIDGFALLRRLQERGGAPPVIMLTGHGRVDMAVRALKEGARDFIEKPFDGEDLVRRLDGLGAPPDDPRQAALARFDLLTPRETDVMREVVAGHPNKVIGHRLGLSPKTVEVHRARIMEKTGVANLPQLVRLALKAGIDPEGDGGGEPGPRGNP